MNAATHDPDRFAISRIIDCAAGRLQYFSALDTIGVGRAALNFGWRRVPEGLREATLVDNNHESEHLHLPQDWVSRQDILAAQQGVLEAHAAEWWPSLLAQSPAEPERQDESGKAVAEHGLILAMRCAKSPSYARIAALEECQHGGRIVLPDSMVNLLRHCVNTIVDVRYGTTARAMFRSAGFLRVRQLQRRDYLYRQIASRMRDATASLPSKIPITLNSRRCLTHRAKRQPCTIQLAPTG